MSTEKSNGGPFVTFREECEILRGRIAELEVDNKKAWGTVGEMAERLAAVLNERNELAAAIEAKDAAIETHLNPCGCFNGCEFCNGKITLKEALVVKPSPDLLAKRDQMRDAALLREVSRLTIITNDVFNKVRSLAAAREAGEWNPILEIK